MMAPKQLHALNGGQTHPIGTGPFTFQSWTPGSTFVAGKNPHYWQKGLPHLNELTFKVLTDPNTMSAALQSGSVDMASMESANAANQLAGQFHEIRNWDTSPGMAMTNVLPTVNGAFNPVSNLHARLALAYATNRQSLAEVQGQGVKTTTSPFAPSSPWGMPESQNGYPVYSIQKAKEQVTQYEQQTHQPSLDVTLLGTADSDTARIMQVLQSQWKQAGINTKIQSQDAQSEITQVVTGKYEVVLFPLYSAPDPDENYLFWTSANAKGAGNISINFTQYKSAAIDHNLGVGRSSPVTATRKAAYDDIVREINAAAINIWTYADPATLIADSAINGYDQAEQVPFGNFQPKLWLADLWLSK
jgi:peptide/nickel transport system substrate-binding protein